MDIRHKFPDIAVVVTATITEVSVAAKYMKNGAVDCIIKPVNANTIPSIIERVLRRRVVDCEPRNYQHCPTEFTEPMASDSANKREAFLHSVAQEIRTPLTAVIASSELLEDAIHNANDELVRKLAGNIRRSAWSLNKNLQQLLDQARENGESSETHRIQPVPQDLLPDRHIALAIQDSANSTFPDPLTRSYDSRAGDLAHWRE